MIALQKNLNALIILTISGILLGAFTVQFFEREKPCPLCLMQRLMMIGVACSCLLNIFYGIRPSHYGLGLLCSLGGASIALRQIALHVCPGMPGFGQPVFGLSLYTWSFIIFACCILAFALLLMLYNPHDSEDRKNTIPPLGKLAFVSLYLLTAANAVAAFVLCGLGPCEG